jgi:signal transduction histidine kinase
MGRWRTLVIVLGVLLGSVALLNVWTLATPNSSTRDVMLTMMLSGAVATLLTYALYKSNLLSRLGSLQWALAVFVLVTTGFIVVSLWALTQRLFFSPVYLISLFGLLLFATLTALAFGYFLARAMTERLRQLQQATDDVARGRLNVVLPVLGNDEIAHLTSNFNAMARELATVDARKRELEATRRDLIAWVSHDLRTPLTSMRVLIEALADGIVTDDATRNRYLQTSLAEIAHLSSMLDDLFELAQLDAKGISLDLMPTSLNDLMSDAVSAFVAKAEQKSQQLRLSLLEGDDTLMIAPDKIQRVLANLLSNAVKYAPREAQIHLQASSCADGVQISVSNDGVSLSETELEKIFESFYRVERSRHDGDGERGTGLGLAIARGFVEAHGGKIWAVSQPNNVTFYLTLQRGKNLK